jgi:hypothetical protein
LQLTDRQPIFVGCKMDGSMRRQIESLTGPERKYVSGEEATSLRVCRLGDQDYIGRVVAERLSTERVDDIRRNVLSILQRLLPDTRLQPHLDILVCEGPVEGAHGEGDGSATGIRTPV